jgi:hypothetical protein
MVIAAAWLFKQAARRKGRRTRKEKKEIAIVARIDCGCLVNCANQCSAELTSVCSK